MLDLLIQLPFQGVNRFDESNSDELQLRLPISTLIEDLSDTFGSLRTNTFMTLTQFAVSDLVGRPVQERSISNGLMASDVIPDLNPPTLVAFDLDLGESILTLSWSKPVLDSTLDFSRLQLQNMADSPTVTRGLSPNSMTGSEDGSVIEIMLTYDDSTFLKDITNNIADSRATTFISAEARAVEGALANRESIEPDDTLQVTTFTADEQPPGVVAFELDLNANTLILTFDEKLTDVTATGIQFQDSESSANYTLTDSTHSFSDNIATFTLGPADQDGIKSNPGFLTNSVIALLSGSATDVFENEVTTTDVYEVVGEITQDMVKPELLGFELDLSREILSLSFSEVVDTSSIQLSGLTIQNMRSVNPSSYYVLTNSSSVSSTQGRVVEVHLIGDDAIEIKANSALATTMDDTYIVVDATFIADFAGNSVVAIDGSNALQATDVIEDTSRPRLMRFGINLSTSVLSLTFSEAINITTFDPTQIQLSNEAGISFNLSGGSYVREHAAVINIYFAAIDNTFLKSQAQLGTFGSSITNTYLSISSDAAEDTSTNTLIQVSSTMPYPASYIVADNRGPLIVAFTLDMNDGNLTIHFDEVVTIDSFDATTISLSGAKSASSSSYTLSTDNTPVLHNSGLYVMVTLTDDDLNGIKGQEICNSTAECYISHTSGIVSDELGNAAPARDVSNAVRASEVGTDFENPTYVQYVQFDLDSGMVTLEFSETMYGASAQFSSSNFGFSPSPLSPAVLYLTGGEVVDSTTPEFQFRIDNDDLNRIKAMSSICTNGFSCIPQFTRNFITDYAGNPVEEFLEAQNIFGDPRTFPQLPQLGFIDDETDPTVVSFSLDLEEGEITFTFDETIQFIQPIQVTIQNSQNATIMYRLEETTTSMFITATMVTIDIDEIDVLQLKGTAGLAKDENNTYITYTSAAFRDQNDNDAQERLDEDALQATLVARDITSPVLVEFPLLDFTQNTLTLVFSEPVDPGSYNYSRVSMHSQSLGGFTHTLTGGTPRVDTSDETLSTILLKLAAADVLALHNESSIATSHLNSYISLEPGAISDFSENPVLASGVIQLETSGVITDSQPAILSDFTLNMNFGVLILTFDDVVVASSLNPTVITIVSDETASDTVNSYQLTDGTTTSSDGDVIEIQLVNEDVVQLRLRSGLATSETNTYVQYTSGLIQDFYNEIGVLPIEIPALRVTVFIPDSIPPTLVSFNLCIENATLELYFSEIMEPGTFTPGLFTLQAAENFTTSSTNFFSLTGGSAYRSDPNTLIIVNLTDYDVNGIKMQVLLATDENNTFISIAEGGIRDTGGNSLIPIPPESAVKASLLKPDTEPPVLLDIILDLDEGELQFEFSEPVIAENLHERFQLHNTVFNVPHMNPTLRVDTGSSVTVVVLSDEDLVYIKGRDTIGTYTMNTLITVNLTGIVDYGGFPPSDNVLIGESVDAIVADTTGPEIVSSTLDLNSGLSVIYI